MLFAVSRLCWAGIGWGGMGWAMLGCAGHCIGSELCHWCDGLGWATTCCAEHMLRPCCAVLHNRAAPLASCCAASAAAGDTAYSWGPQHHRHCSPPFSHPSLPPPSRLCPASVPPLQAVRRLLAALQVQGTHQPEHAGTRDMYMWDVWAVVWGVLCTNPGTWARHIHCRMWPPTLRCFLEPCLAHTHRISTPASMHPLKPPPCTPCHHLDPPCCPCRLPPLARSAFQPTNQLPPPYSLPFSF